MHVLIIGGTGNISRAIVQVLLREGHNVTIYNRGQRIDAPPSDVEVLLGDRRDRAAFEALLHIDLNDAHESRGVRCAGVDVDLDPPLCMRPFCSSFLPECGDCGLPALSCFLPACIVPCTSRFPR